MLWHCWFGARKTIRWVKTEWWGVGVIICLEQGADRLQCIWSSWCHCIPKSHTLMRHLNPDWVYLSGTGLSRLSRKRGRLTGAVAVVVVVVVVIVRVVAAAAAAVFLTLVLVTELRLCDWRESTSKRTVGVVLESPASRSPRRLSESRSTTRSARWSTAWTWQRPRRRRGCWAERTRCPSWSLRTGTSARRPAHTPTDWLWRSAETDLGLKCRIHVSNRCTTPWVKKNKDTKLLPITTPNMNRFSKLFFTDGLGGIFATKSCLNIPPRLKYVATLPCEILLSEKWRKSEICIVINDTSPGSIAKYLRCDGSLY